MAQPTHQADWPMPPGVADAFSTAAVRFMTQRHWTESDLSHLPQENRYEIIDGRLLVTPPASEDHQDWCSWAFRILDHAAPQGWRVQWDIGLRLGENLFIPDLVVLAPDAQRANTNYNRVTPAVVVEVESRSTKSVDRVDKLEAYAEAGIGSYWRIERDGKVNIYRLGGDVYSEPLALGPGNAAELDHPYPVSVAV
ncbi:MAG: Uma2 family endonuclease, partial [Micromonosporaceae bacterium]